MCYWYLYRAENTPLGGGHDVLGYLRKETLAEPTVDELRVTLCNIQYYSVLR